MTIRAKYSGTCAVCGGAIRIGDPIDWRRGEPTRHAACTPPEIPADAVTIVGCGAYGGWRPGEVLASPYKDGPRFLTVLTATRRHYGEDALSFGDTDDCGWVASATCRPATDEEAAPLIEAERERQTQAAAEQRLRDLADRIRREGERPEGPVTPEGERVLDRQTIYGGGDWFVLGPEHVWYVRNNGADGDDWRANNVRTGGAGAIGWRLPRDEATVAEMLELEALLDPAAAEARALSAAGALGRRAWERHVAPHLPADSPWVPAAAEGPAKPPLAAFVRLAEHVYGGLDLDGRPWLAANDESVAEDVYRGPYAPGRMPTGYGIGYLSGQYAVALRYDATPERLAAIATALPTWTTAEVVASALAEARLRAGLWPEFRARRDARVADGMSLDAAIEAARAETDAEIARRMSDLAAASPAPRPGRYKLPRSEGWAASDRDAVGACARAGEVLSDVELHTPDVRLLYGNGESRFTGKPFGLWSDGTATTGECRSEPADELPAAVAELLKHAIRQPEWRAGGAWKELLDVDAVESIEVLDRWERRSGGGSAEVALERLTVRYAPDITETLYRVSYVWGSMAGGDGDTGDGSFIDRNEAAARARFSEEVKVYA